MIAGVAEKSPAIVAIKRKQLFSDRSDGRDCRQVYLDDRKDRCEVKYTGMRYVHRWQLHSKVAASNVATGFFLWKKYNAMTVWITRSRNSTTLTW